MLCCRAAGLLIAGLLIACSPEQEPLSQAKTTPAKIAQAELAQPEPAKTQAGESDSVALFDQASLESLRGRVIYSQTAQPISQVWVRLVHGDREQIALTTDTGHFFTKESLPDGEVRAFVALDENGPWLEPESVLLQHSSAGAASTIQTLRIKAGPSYSLDFLSHASDEPARWEARLIEVGSGDRKRAWAWQVLRPGDPPLLRYASPRYPPQEEWKPFVEVRQRGKDWFGRARVEGNQGGRTKPLKLKLIQYASFGGILIDANGRPIDEAQVDLLLAKGTQIPAFYDDPQTAWSDVDGVFGYPAILEPGHYHMTVRSEGRENSVLDVEIIRGNTGGFEFRLDAVIAHEQIPVALLGPDEGPLPAAIVSLRSLGSKYPVRRSLHTKMGFVPHGFVEQSGIGYGMLFADLIPGRYELSIFGLDGIRYVPESLVVELPLDLEGISFLQVNNDPPRELHFAVLPKDGENELAFHSVRISSKDWWYPSSTRVEQGVASGSVALDSPAGEWMVWAPGYQPKYGNLAQLDATQSGPAVIDVELSKGWGAEIIVRDATEGVPRPNFDAWQLAAYAHQANPIEGVLVIAEGTVVGHTNAAGRARISMDAKPGDLMLYREGWRVMGAGGGLEDMDILDRERGAVIWMEPKF
ncbi:MAG: hypothetical protein ACI8X5_001616 [Planctomycetota bacterium]|jgi:hypothetical protein